jgi:hypothetical protein
MKFAGPLAYTMVAGANGQFAGGATGGAAQRRGFPLVDALTAGPTGRLIDWAS